MNKAFSFVFVILLIILLLSPQQEGMAEDAVCEIEYHENWTNTENNLILSGGDAEFPIISWRIPRKNIVELFVRDDITYEHFYHVKGDIPDKIQYGDYSQPGTYRGTLAPDQAPPLELDRSYVFEMYFDGYNFDRLAAEITGPCSLAIKLTYPVGKSPKIFTKGWVFGAMATYSNNGTTVDISDQVMWSGTGTFSPNKGSRSYPLFTAEGTNKITLTVELEGESYHQDFSVEAVSPVEYARVTDMSHSPADAHGCPACAHSVIGPIISGSPNVSIDGLPAARAGDVGVAAACCGPNMFWLKHGDHSILIDGSPAAKKGDPTKHCGSSGLITTGYSGFNASLGGALEGLDHAPHTCEIKNVVKASLVGDGSISGKVTDIHGVGIYGVGVTAYSSSGTDIWGTLTDGNGQYKIEGLPDDSFAIFFWGGNWAYNDGYISNWYNDKSDKAVADTVTIKDGGTITDIDTTLAKGGSINGIVTDAHGNPVYKGTLKAVDESGGLFFSYTKEDGSYKFAGLADGDYRVFCSAKASGCLEEWYNNKPSQGTSTIVSVSAVNTVSGIDFSLGAGSGISGTVRGSGGKGIKDIYVKVFGKATGITGMGVTDENGKYDIKGLPADSYRVQFQGENTGYRDLWYSAQTSWDASTMVTVASENFSTGIDAELTLADDDGSPLTASSGGGGGGGCFIDVLRN